MDAGRAAPDRTPSRKADSQRVPRRRSPGDSQRAGESLPVAVAVRVGGQQIAPLAQLVPGLDQDERRRGSWFDSHRWVSIHPRDRVAEEATDLRWRPHEPEEVTV